MYYFKNISLDVIELGNTGADVEPGQSRAFNTVGSREEIADNAFHLIIEGKTLQNLSYIPGQHVRIFIGMDKDLGLREKIRTYSIWNYHSSNGTINLVICTHSDGTGSA